MNIFEHEQCSVVQFPQHLPQFPNIMHIMYLSIPSLKESLVFVEKKFHLVRF